MGSLRAWLLAALVAAALSGCKQGEGDVCQIDDDCEDGLVCNAATMTCQQEGASSTADAAPDAPPAADASQPDAADEPDAAE